MSETSSNPNHVPSRSRGRYRRRTATSRERRLTARFTDDELDVIRDAADAAELTLAAFCGLAALTAAQPRGRDDQGEPSRDELAEMQRELFAARVAVNRAGTNLNQAVAAFNATGEPPVWLEHVVARAMKAVDEVDRVASRIHRRLR